LSARRASALRLAAALGAALGPAAARPQGQAVVLGTASGPGATVLGRVCLDLDGDRRCAAAEPGVAGARVLGEGGQVALADGEGRFHLLEVPDRVVLPDRAAYGGHALAVEGLGVRRAFELAPVGAAQVDLAVPAREPPAAPALAPAGVAGREPVREEDGRLRWDLGGRTAPGATVAVGAERVTAGADGLFAAEVLLSPGENRLTASVTSGQAAAIYSWTVLLLRRPSGGDLVAPRVPERLAVLGVAPGAGGALLVGRAAAGLAVRVGGVLAAPGPGGLLAAWAPAGEAAVEVHGGGAEPLARATLPVPAGAALRAAAVLAEIEVAFGGDPGVLTTARGAGAVRARLGAVDVEAGVDLDDRDRHGELADLVRPRDAIAVEHALDPDRSLAATGDASAAGDRNPGRGRLWARVRTEGARLDLGTARADLGGGELGRYDRALFGGVAAAEGSAGPVLLEASAFGATLREDAGGSGPPVPAHDVLAALGGATYWLAHGEVAPGSESLRVEWRDPLTGRLAGARSLVRGEDYEIDWTTGRVVLAAPLPSVGGAPAVVTADPFAAPQAALVVDYLHAGTGGGGEDLRGGRVGAAMGPLALSAHAADEERPEGGYRLLGAVAALDLGPLLKARAEAARSRGALFARGGEAGFSRSVDGGYAFGGAGAADGEADALHLEARSEAGPVALDAWWRERGAGYSDAEFHEAVAARERGAAVSAAAGRLSGAVLLAERRGADPRDPAGLASLETRTLVARGGWMGERLGLVLEGVHVDRDAPLAGEETSAGARATWRVDPTLALDLSHHQGLRTSGEGRDPTFTAAGATFARGKSALAVRGGWGPELGPRVLVSGERGGEGEAIYGTFTADPDAPDVLGGAAGASALGARRSAGPAEVFVEEQLARDAFGLRASRVFGLALAPRSGLRVALTGERGERLRTDGSRAARSAAAGTASLVAGPVRLAARGEVRTEGDDEQAAAGGSAEWEPFAGAALQLRVGWVEGTVGGRDALGLDVALAGALRAEWCSVLASLARIVEMRPGGARRDGVVARLAATAAAGRRVELGLGAALALQEVAGGEEDRLAGSARARVRIAGPLDGAVEYARRAPLDGDDIGALDAFRVEAGLGARESRLALGYTLIGFGGDGLEPAGDTGRLYVRAQLAY
jgi:hypothetical protein